MSDMWKLLLPIVLTHVVVLVVVIVLIKRILLGDTSKAVESVREVEAEIRKKEAGIREQIEEHERVFQQQKIAAEKELDEHRTQADKEVARARDQVLGEAKAEADRLIEQAKRNEEKFRQQISQDMEEKAVLYSGEIFDLVFTEKMAEAVDQVFTGELLDALDALDSTSITVDTNDVAFTAARPIAPEQKARLEAILKEKFEADIKVQEDIQEDLVAGLAFKLGSLEIDGSLSNRMKEAVEEVKKHARG
ncbi:MAG: F0F1 ATP synthase subunit delta [Kiritimatiellae bacterium]|nr:F0F1 ATP synthase subunit delta [Kiritimatiellia bacterium]